MQDEMEAGEESLGIDVEDHQRNATQAGVSQRTIPQYDQSPQGDTPAPGNSQVL